MAFGGFYLGTWIREDTFIFLGGGLAARVRTRRLNIHPSIPYMFPSACPIVSFLGHRPEWASCSGKMGQLFR